MSEKQRLTDKEARCVEYYTNPESETYQNWTECYKRAEYSLHHGWRRNAARVKAKSHIKAKIEAERAKIRVESSVTREYCVDKLQNIVENGESERNKISAMSLIGDFCGFKRENAPNAEKEANRRTAMSVEDARVAEAVAKLRTGEASKAKIVKIGA